MATAPADAPLPTADWLAGQRWFRAKRRPIAGVAEVERAALDAVTLLVLEVSYADGGPADRYLLPMVADGKAPREPRDGDGAMARLVRAIADGADLRGERGGRFTFTPGPALDELLPSPRAAATALTERGLGVEQSNTSVVLGERLILKLYRLLEPGINPDLEVTAFLARTGFRDIPAVAGSALFCAAGAVEESPVAMLSAFVPSRGDAWTIMLDALARDPAEATALAERIGRLTGELHAALASRPTEPGFPVRVATVDEVAAWRAAAERELADAAEAVTGAEHARLVELGPTLRARFADAFGAAAGSVPVSRIHGDLHLGQLLAARDGRLVVIDFEGEPARGLDQRRALASPLRDAAGMLRSIDYAARSAAAAGATRLDPDAWVSEARAAFLGAYRSLDASERALLEALELEKACYEVRYEANFRPAWLWLPLDALERMARG